MPRSATAWFAFVRTRAFTVGAVLTIWSCCAVILWAVFDESLYEPDLTHVVSAAAGVTFVAAALALIRRSWARVPFLGICLIAGITALPEQDHEPSGMYVLGYFVLAIVMMLLAGVALLIAALTPQPTPRASAD